MAYLDELLRQALYTQPVGTDLGLPKGGAYASYFPTYETQTPQYTTPNPYTMAQIGYRTNELVYALISKRAKALSEAPLWVWDNTGETPEELDEHPIYDLLKHANQGIGEKMFWKITSIYRDIAGFAAWEIERSNNGDPLRLWPMMPHYCSTLRGEQKIMRAIRYQPYGLPPADIPIENIIFFGSFDPLYYGSRFLSPTMIAMEQIGVDNSMTDFLLDFVKHGAKFSGLLSVAQTIDDTTAQDYKRRFRDAHGGTQNWSDPLVLGLGAKYESMQMNFRDMAFPELDARTESKICMAFEMSPILVSAKVGLDRSTFSNYEQASKSWYNEWVHPEWLALADTFGTQVLPMYNEEDSKLYCEFNLTEIYALQEDRTAQVDRAVKMFEKKLATLNESREEMQLDPVDGKEGEQFYKAPEPTVQKVDTNGNETKPNEKNPIPPQLQGAVASSEDRQKEKDLEDEEIKDFRAFAKRRIKEGKAADIFEFEFKYVPVERQEELVAKYNVLKPDNSAALVLDGIKAALQAMDRQPAPVQSQPMNITVHSYPQEPPTVNIENKSSDVNMPAPTVTVVNKVEPTPVNITNTQPAQASKAKKAKLTKRDDGTITIEEA
jgi:HK97 family phage portal protein